MRKVIFAINSTADGYCSHTDMMPEEEQFDFFIKLLRDAGLILFGRTTYQLMVPYWPDVAKDPSSSKSDLDFARAFDSIDKIVFSTTLKDVGGRNTRIVRGNVAEEVMALKQRPGRDILAGSLGIASQLSERGLIDEYHFTVHPVIAGKGPRLFDTVKLQETIRLDLVGSKTFQSGVVALHYKKRT